MEGGESMSEKIAIFVGEATEIENKINEFLQKKIQIGDERTIKMEIKTKTLTATSLLTGEIAVILLYELSPSLTLH